MSRFQLSVVIPMHNEADYIGECLRALVPQERHLHEIIVVDNNSTDSSAEVVRRFADASPKIVIEHEERPGVVHARSRGFDRATGTVIGRIDADTRVAPDWAESILRFFDTQPRYDAVYGPPTIYGSPYSSLINRALTRKARKAAAPVADFPFALGHNMALRSSVWAAVRDRVSPRPDVHEDLDLSLVLAEQGHAIARDLRISAEVSARRASTSPLRYRQYTDAMRRTLALHHKLGIPQHVQIALQWASHSVHWPVHRMYDPATGRFSPRRLFRDDARALPID